MAFSVKQIKALLSEHGLPVDNLEAAADEICRRHAADLDSIKEERDSYRKDAEALAATKAELDALKAQPGDGFKEKYETVRKEFAEYKDTVAKEKALEAKRAAYQDLCKDAGLNEKGIAKAVKYADWDAIELDEAGKVVDAKAHLKSIREEWAEHIKTEGEQGVQTPNPPGSNGGGNRKTKEEIYAMKDPAARQQAILDNHELFGI